MLAVDAASVTMEDADTGAIEPLRDLLPRMRADGVAAVAPNGVLGDPTTASAAAGHAFLEQAIAELTALLRDWDAA
jgi:creatinine amidohydrolase